MANRKITYLDKNAGIVDGEWDDAELDETSKKLLKQLKGVKYIEVQSIKLDVLIRLSKYHNTEFGIMKKQSNMIAVVKGRDPKPGTAGVFNAGDGPAGYDVILHVHPAFGSYDWHFQIDKQHAKGIEAVVDWNGNVIVYDDEGVKNKKESGGRYIGLTDKDKHWPSKFINSNRIVS